MNKDLSSLEQSIVDAWHNADYYEMWRLSFINPEEFVQSKVYQQVRGIMFQANELLDMAIEQFGEKEYENAYASLEAAIKYFPFGHIMYPFAVGLGKALGKENDFDQQFSRIVNDNPPLFKKINVMESEHWLDLVDRCLLSCNHNEFDDKCMSALEETVQFGKTHFNPENILFKYLNANNLLHQERYDEAKIELLGAQHRDFSWFWLMAKAHYDETLADVVFYYQHAVYFVKCLMDEAGELPEKLAEEYRIMTAEMTYISSKFHDFKNVMGYNQLLLEIIPEAFEAYFHMACAKLRMGDLSGAEEDFSSYMQQRNGVPPKMVVPRFLDVVDGKMTTVVGDEKFYFHAKFLQIGFLKGLDPEDLLPHFQVIKDNPAAIAYVVNYGAADDLAFRVIEGSDTKGVIHHLHDTFNMGVIDEITTHQTADITGIDFTNLYDMPTHFHFHKSEPQDNPLVIRIVMDEHIKSDWSHFYLMIPQIGRTKTRRILRVSGKSYGEIQRQETVSDDFFKIYFDKEKGKMEMELLTALHAATHYQTPQVIQYFERELCSVNQIREITPINLDKSTLQILEDKDYDNQSIAHSMMVVLADIHVLAPLEKAGVPPAPEEYYETTFTDLDGVFSCLSEDSGVGREVLEHAFQSAASTLFSMIHSSPNGLYKDAFFFNWILGEDGRPHPIDFEGSLILSPLDDVAFVAAVGGFFDIDTQKMLVHTYVDHQNEIASQVKKPLMDPTETFYRLPFFGLFRNLRQYANFSRFLKTSDDPTLAKYKVIFLESARDTADYLSLKGYNEFAQLRDSLHMVRNNLPSSLVELRDIPLRDLYLRGK